MIQHNPAAPDNRATRGYLIALVQEEHRLRAFGKYELAICALFFISSPFLLRFFVRLFSNRWLLSDPIPYARHWNYLISPLASGNND